MLQPLLRAQNQQELTPAPVAAPAQTAAPAAAAPAPDAPAPQATTQATPATAPQPSPETATPATAAAPPEAGSPGSANAGEVSEQELRTRLVGKQLFLRGGYQGESLSFTEHGEAVGHPAAGSYTLSAVEIDKVHISKHKVELEGARYGLHFLGALPYEDPSKAVDRVKITPKKKVLKITIDREEVAKPKKVKEAKPQTAAKPGRPPVTAAGGATAMAATPPVEDANQSGASVPAAPAPGASATAPTQAEADTAAEPAEKPEEQAADPASVTVTTSPAHAAKMLRDALDKIFATGLDDKLMAQMPPFWQLYYQAQAAGIDYHTKDPQVLRPSAVDTQAKPLSPIAPGSNDFAQTSGIAGRSLYRAVIEPDGTPGEIAVVRPIGFGLDETAVEAIRKTKFQPASKNGSPVAETIDLAVLFRIYSKLTSGSATASPTADQKPEEVKPGPYSVRDKGVQP